MWEVLFQVVLYAVVFLFYSFDRNAPHIEGHKFVFFANYGVAALIVNYYLLPKLLYARRYIPFFIALVVIIAIVIVLEEAVLEKIYFPDTKGKYFPGVFFSLVDVLPVIMILFGMKFGWDAIKKQNEVEQLKGLMENSELSFLKSQINPHFLFNNLNNLYSYALENSPKTPKIILELSSVLRYMLYECKEKFVPLKNELKQLQNFVQLNELQIEERGDVQLSLPDNVGDHLIAPLILMVFVENAFKHSAASQDVGIAIDIRVTIEEGKLHFLCSNNYQHTSDNKAIDEGIGLQNVKKRLELIYPKKHVLTITQKDSSYQVELIINLSNDH